MSLRDNRYGRKLGSISDLLPVYIDSGDGVTEQSLEFWKEHKDKLGNIVQCEVGFEPLISNEENGRDWTFIAWGTGGIIILSGVCSGYGGTGPNGTAKILAELGIPMDWARKLMLNKHIDLRFTGEDILSVE